MSFIQIQGIIFFSIIIFSIMCGKNGTLIASIIWIVETIIIYKTSRSNYLQVICVSLSFQIGMIVAIIRDFIVKKMKKTINKDLN